ncbi:MAG: GTPase RsgA, partial [Planctomycetota bacterium]
MSQEIREAWVIYKSSRNVRVRSDGREWLCSLRGKLREIDRRSGRSPVVVGDNVRIRPLGDDEAVLEEVLPRTNEVRRSKSTPGKEGLPSWKAVRTQARRERVVAANMDQILLVLAAKTPAPRWGLVDRVLVSATYDELDVGICLNKWDQVAGDEEAHEALTDGGVLAIWINLFRIRPRHIRAVVRTLREVFPYVQGFVVESTSLVMSASNAPPQWDERLESRIERLSGDYLEALALATPAAL